MKLTPKAQQQFIFSINCYEHGLCTPEELLHALHKIYKEDLNKQSDFLIEKGFSASGAFNHIHNCDKGSEVI
jgi:hypothetical protein